MDWYYYNENDEKVGPVRGSDLKQLAEQGTITPDTQVEDQNGKTALAGKVIGLFERLEKLGTDNPPKRDDLLPGACCYMPAPSRPWLPHPDPHTGKLSCFAYLGCLGLGSLGGIGVVYLGFLFCKKLFGI